MAGEAEIKTLIETSMESLRKMIDVNTVIGDMVETKSGAAIIPVSRVSCGFMTGGGQYGKEIKQDLLFAGGSGAGVSIHPVGFLVVNGNEVRLIATDGNSGFDKAFDALQLLLETWEKRSKKSKESKVAENTQ